MQPALPLAVRSRCIVMASFSVPIQIMVEFQTVMTLADLGGERNPAFPDSGCSRWFSARDSPNYCKSKGQRESPRGPTSQISATCQSRVQHLQTDSIQNIVLL